MCNYNFTILIEAVEVIITINKNENVKNIYIIRTEFQVEHLSIKLTAIILCTKIRNIQCIIYLNNSYFLLALVSNGYHRHILFAP